MSNWRHLLAVAVDQKAEHEMYRYEVREKISCEVEDNRARLKTKFETVPATS